VVNSALTKNICSVILYADYPTFQAHSLATSGTACCLQCAIQRESKVKTMDLLVAMGFMLCMLYLFYEREERRKPPKQTPH
jgi:hypothetical protein